MKFQTESTHDLQDRVEAGAAFARKGFVEAFAGESRVAGNLCHAFGTSDVAKSLGDKGSVTVCFFEASFKIGRHLLWGSEMF